MKSYVIVLFLNPEVSYQGFFLSLSHLEDVGGLGVGVLLGQVGVRVLRESRVPGEPLGRLRGWALREGELSRVGGRVPDQSREGGCDALADLLHMLDAGCEPTREVSVTPQQSSEPC